MSNTYSDLLKNKAELDAQMHNLNKQIQDARQAELKTVIAQIKGLMADHNITVDDLGGKSVVKTDARRKVEAKYRNTDTGETWTGRGLKPKWLKEAIAQGKQEQDFLIAR